MQSPMLTTWPTTNAQGCAPADTAAMPIDIGNIAKPHRMKAISFSDLVACSLGSTNRGTISSDATTPYAMTAVAINAVGVLASAGYLAIVAIGGASARQSRMVSASHTYGARRSDPPRRS